MKLIVGTSPRTIREIRYSDFSIHIFPSPTTITEGMFLRLGEYKTVAITISATYCPILPSAMTALNDERSARGTVHPSMPPHPAISIFMPRGFELSYFTIGMLQNFY